MIFRLRLSSSILPLSGHTLPAHPSPRLGLQVLSSRFGAPLGKGQVLIIFYIPGLSAMLKYGHLISVELNYTWKQTSIFTLKYSKTPHSHYHSLVTLD